MTDTTAATTGHVFVSHTGQDDMASNFAANLVDYLRSQNIDYFYDAQSIEPGDRWKAKIESNVRTCRVFVCILSPRYFERYWCMHELDIALDAKRQIIPVYLECGPPGTDDDLRRHFGCDDRVNEDVLSRWCRNIEQLREIQGIRNYSNEKDWQLGMKRKIVDAVDCDSKREGRHGKPWSLPYRSMGSCFKGREKFIEKLRASLERPRKGQLTSFVCTALHGLGGVGKTRLAVEYAWRYGTEYSAVLFVSAETPENLQNNLASQCRILPHLPEYNETKRDALAAVLRWLDENPVWLLILDEVDTAEAASAAEDLLADLDGGDVLLTSRLGQWSKPIESLELDVLAVDDASKFLLEWTEGKRLKHRSDTLDAKELAKELDGLPLALQQAGAYIVSKRVSLSAYLEAWPAQEPKVLEWYDPRLMKYPRQLSKTWQTTMDQFGGGELALLRLFSWLAPSPVPIFMLKGKVVESVWRDAVDLVRKEGMQLTKPKEGLWDALNKLADYGMVHWDGENQTISMHRVEHEILRSQVPVTQRKRWQQLILCLLATLIRTRMPLEHQKLWLQLILRLIDEARSSIGNLGVQGDEMISFVQHLTYVVEEIPSDFAAGHFHAAVLELLDMPIIDEELYRHGLFQPAADLARALSRHASFVQKRQRMRLQHILGYTNAGLGYTFEAILAFEQMLLEQEEQQHADSLDKGSALGNLGFYYARVGRTSDSCRSHEEALDIARKLPDVDQELLNKAQELEGNQLVCLGILQGRLGNSMEGLNCLEKGWDILHRLGIEKAEPGICGYKAEILLDLGRLDDALVAAERSTKLTREMKEWWEASKHFTTLGIIRLARGELEDAHLAIEEARQHEDPIYNHHALFVLGIIALRQGGSKKEEACAVLRAAVDEAGKSLKRCRQHFDALYCRGLARCGLAICNKDEQQTRVAIKDFSEAKSLNTDEGTIKRVRRLFLEMKRADSSALACCESWLSVNLWPLTGPFLK